jgi:uncharacterized protein (TIGR03118 family)
MLSSSKFWKALPVFAFSLFLLPALTFAQYTRKDLVANSGVSDTVPPVPTMADSHLVNGWGLTALPSGSPWWVSDNVTGFSTLYAIKNSAQGVSASPVPLFVTILPSANGGTGSPTGVVANTTGGFTFTVNGHMQPFAFIFATFDGTISAWNPAVDPIDPSTHASTASLKVDRSGAGAVYTGLAIGTNAGNPLLFAADDGPNRRIDVFDTNFSLVDPTNNTVGLGPDAFTDPNIPRDFAPYGIQTVTTTAADGSKTETVWVTYTALNKAQSGFVDAFTTSGVLLTSINVQGPLHSPWGIALAPADFGPMSNALLISNNTSRGRINAFDPNTGAFLGPLRDASNKPIEIDNVWALQFGNAKDMGNDGNHNQLFFTAGPNGYGNGLFGVITFGQ